MNGTPRNADRRDVRPGASCCAVCRDPFTREGVTMWVMTDGVCVCNACFACNQLVAHWKDAKPWNKSREPGQSAQSVPVAEPPKARKPDGPYLGPDVLPEPGKDVRIRLESWQEFMDQAAIESIPPPPGKEDSENWNASRRTVRKFGGYIRAFQGSKDFEEALGLAREGWPEGRERVLAMLARLGHVMGSRNMRLEPVHDVEGSYPDVARFVEGDPENMVQLREDVGGGCGKVVTIAAANSYTSDVTAEQAARRGAAVVAVIDAIERSGRRVELWIVNACKSTESGVKGGMIHEVLVKAAQEPLELDRLAFAFMNTASARRLSWAIRERFHRKIRKAWGIGLGDGDYGRTYRADLTGGADLNFGPPVPGNASQFDTDESTVHWIKDQLRVAGLQLEELAAV